MSKIVSKEILSKNGIKVILRNALLKDAQQILKLNKEIIKEGPFMLHEPDEYKVTVKKERGQIKNFTDNPCRLYLIAEVNNKIAGYLTFINGGLRRTAHMGYIGLFIKKKYRGIGIGRILLNELIVWGKQNPSIEKLSLAVFSSNPVAMALYKSVGFKQEGRCRRDLKMNNAYVDQIIMYMFV